MATFVMVTRLSPEALTRPQSVSDLNRHVAERVKQRCPGVEWITNYSISGPYDYLDVFEAPDNETATKVGLLVRSFGHATTEIWIATQWDRFARLAQELKG